MKLPWRRDPLLPQKLLACATGSWPKVGATVELPSRGLTLRAVRVHRGVRREVVGKTLDTAKPRSVRKLLSAPIPEGELYERDCRIRLRLDQGAPSRPLTVGNFYAPSPTALLRGELVLDDPVIPVWRMLTLCCSAGLSRDAADSTCHVCGCYIEGGVYRSYSSAEALFSEQLPKILPAYGVLDLALLTEELNLLTEKLLGKIFVSAGAKLGR